MPDLAITVESAAAVPFAAAPTLAFKLAINNTYAGEHIHTVVLRTQIQIEVTRRRYEVQEQERLRDLFGEPDRWSQTLRSMLWTHATAVIPAFTGATTVDLQVPCTFDFNVAATKYFHGLIEGDIPLILMFSGSVFYADDFGGLLVAPISWSKDARYRLPLNVWKDMMEAYYPNSAWLALRKDVFEKLYQYKMRNGIPTWEQAIETILAFNQEPVRS